MKEEHYNDYLSDYDCKDVKCEICGGIFRSTHLSRKYCSNDCRDKANKEKSFKQKEITDFVIFERDGFRCVYCGKSSIEDGVRLEIEHIYPVSRDGSAELFNIVTSCSKCNGQKSSTIMSDDNILRLWGEIYNRNKQAGIDHYVTLKQKLLKNLGSRVSRLA
jgi:CRISPR/Cas system Type II protein with McrA/HNH and RuvC-like nuclease domain